MVDVYTDRFAERIKEILSQVPANASKDLPAFIEQYYAKMPLIDLEKIPVKQAYHIAKSSFEWVKKWSGDGPKIRIYTPNKKTHGWESSHTVIEVLNDDRPFLVDSLSAELTRQGFQFYETIHPVISVKRDAKGDLTKIMAADAKTARHESLIHFQLSALSSATDAKTLTARLESILEAARLVVEDWSALINRASTITKRLSNVKGFDKEEVSEVRDFMRWLGHNNFVFMGYIEYDFQHSKKGMKITPVEGAELGLFRSEDPNFCPPGLAALPPEVHHFASAHTLIQITKSNRKSAVHRPVLMDYIAIKRFNSKGEIIGECRFIGMFTSIVYYQSADTIPFIRRKIARTLQRANYDPASHNGKTLKAILEFFPRDELFQISEEDLFTFSIGVMSVEARPEVRLFVRKDTFERFVSCMVYIPRERFSTYLREQIQHILEKAFMGKTSDFYTQMTDSPLARLHQIVTTKPGNIPEFDVTEIEDQIARLTNLWSDSLREELIKTYGDKEGEKKFRTYASAFPDNYINRYDAQSAMYDVAKLEEAGKDGKVALDLFKLKEEDAHHFHLKIYTPELKIALSDMLPMLENMGCKVVDVNPYRISPKWRKKDISIKDFHLQLEDKQVLALKESKGRFEEALYKVWTAEVANDRFNQLILMAGLSWREVDILRAYSQYLRQVGFPYSQNFVIDAFTAHPELTKKLSALFTARFCPDAKKHAAESEAIYDTLMAALEDVSSLAEDRIFRQFADMIMATLRTNAYQTCDTSGEHKSYLSFKFDSGNVPGLPLPRPYREIFVYSLRMEGIHLRGDKVARGGLRWSDRPEDFRTEVLGLMKAQMVKNAVIVPQGSKGGFVVKQPPKDGDRDALQAEGVTCYKQFLSGLLDLTDNIVGDAIIPPTNIVRHDSDDPYLVVAADKGTATFSDIANGVSEAYGFWLGDAFASGGSVGYDHKAMGITARGAWVSVMRHFREMGHDTQSQDFTVAGIGDMSGDVFGNGMLLSKHIRLVAAFNHRYIFIDPTPDAAKTFKERERLFAKPRSSWGDYNTKLLSKGGGVFARSEKSIKLSKEARNALGTKQQSASPEELIKIILQAPVDLLWNGGIGTYVKAISESHDEVGDRANNNVRINGEQLRCKVVGEGGNLGLTQLGRIEYARNGGRINTDAIDNSAGVDCSDHEVNIKIALGIAVANKSLTRKKRDTLLASMTEDVADLVLIDNKLQTQALSVAEHQGFAQLDAQERMMQDLERQGFLDRAVEFLPNDKQLSELRIAKKGLSRPELSVLLSYAKLALFRDIKDSSLLDAPYFEADLQRYFPEAMHKPFYKEITSHRLRPEIIATIITNSIVNRAGITFMHTMLEESGMHPCDVARAYTIARDAFDLRGIWNAIEALDGKVSGETQSILHSEIGRFLERICLWLLNHNNQPLDVEAIMRSYAKGIAQFNKHYESLISDTLKKAYRNKVKEYKAAKIPTDLTCNIAGLEILGSALDVVQVSNESGLDVKVVGRVYFELGARLRLGWMRRSAHQLQAENYWGRLAIKSLISDFYDQQRRLTASVVSNLCDGDNCSMSIARWEESHAKELERYDGFIADLKQQEAIDSSMLVVAARNVEALGMV